MNYPESREPQTAGGPGVEDLEQLTSETRRITEQVRRLPPGSASISEANVLLRTAKDLLQRRDLHGAKSVLEQLGRLIGPATQGSSSVTRAQGLPGQLIAWLRTPAGLGILVLLGIVVLGGYVRLAALGTGSLWIDEAQSTLYAFSILQHGYPIIHAPHLVNNWEPLYPYLEAVSISVLGHSNFAYRLPSALIGIALIPISYVVGTQVRNRYVGLTLAAMVAFSTEYIAWSRAARWYTLIVMLMVLGYLAALAWSRSRPGAARWRWAAVMTALAILAGLASPGEFLLYSPGILAGGIVYLSAERWNQILAWFGASASKPPAVDQWHRPIFPFRYRGWTILLGLIALLAFVLIEVQAVSSFYTFTLTKLFGFPPYPPVWSDLFGEYLLQYYSAILVLTAISVVILAVRRNPTDLALLAFCGASFISVSVAGSLTNDVAGGGKTFERHILPLIYFLFLLSAITIVEILQRVSKSLGIPSQFPAVFGRAKPIFFGVAVAALLIIPSAVVPSGVTVYGNVNSSPANNLVDWVPFSLFPQYPSALYLAVQANYQLASEYIPSHRQPGDVVAATNPGPPTVYLGPIQYWVRGDAVTKYPNTVIYSNGQPEFYQTGTPLIGNTSQLEELLQTTSGWLIGISAGSAGDAGMNQVLSILMYPNPAASDVSITLYNWSKTTPLGQLHEFWNYRGLDDQYNSNVTRMADWTATTGVSSSVYRLFLIPFEGLLLRLVNQTTLPLATLFSVYNNRADLQREFPGVLEAPSFGNPEPYKPLIQWAHKVVTGALSDPARPILMPYANWYILHG